MAASCYRTTKSTYPIMHEIRKSMHTAWAEKNSRRGLAVKRYAMQCNAMECDAMECTATQRNATQRNGMQHRKTPCNVQCNALHHNASEHNPTQGIASQVIAMSCKYAIYCYWQCVRLFCFACQFVSISLRFNFTAQFWKPPQYETRLFYAMA